MDMDAALRDLTRELNALEMEIRARGFVLAARAADEGADPRIAETRVGYFGIWE